MRRALAAIIVICLAAPTPAAAQMIRPVALRAGPVLPSAPIPSLGSPARSLDPLSLTPLSLSPAAVLPSVAPSVAVKAAAVQVVPNIPFAPALVPVDAAASAALPVKAAIIPALSAAVDAGDPSHPAMFDGAAAQPPSVAVPDARATLGSGLHMARPEHDAWLSSVIGVLSASRTGRRVLRDIDALAAKRGVPVMLDVKAIGNNGEFRYDSDLLIMDSGHLKRDPYQSAPILAHELQHVLQRALELPADALELEIESYTVESRVWSELGIEPEKGSFARMARQRLLKDAPAFAKWLGGQYKNNIALYGSTMQAYIARLEKNLARAKRAEAQTRRKLAAVERVMESMRANGMSEEAVAAHRREDLEPLERSLRDNLVNRAWTERDLLRLKEPSIQGAFRAYARGVMRRARALSRP